MTFELQAHINIISRSTCQDLVHDHPMANIDARWVPKRGVYEPCARQCRLLMESASRSLGNSLSLSLSWSLHPKRQRSREGGETENDRGKEGLGQSVKNTK